MFNDLFLCLIKSLNLPVPVDCAASLGRAIKTQGQSFIDANVGESSKAPK